MAKKEEKQEEKQYQLTAEEQTNLLGRRAMYRHEKYVTSMMLNGIEDDIEYFINHVVKKRLGIPVDQLIEVDVEKGIVRIAKKEEVKQEKPKILDPNGK